MRRLGIGIILVTMLAASLCFNASPSWAQQKGPIRIGFIVPRTGPFAQNGKDMLDSIQVYLEEIGYQAAGRKVELVVEDDEGIPATTLTKGRKLIEKEGVHVIAGVMLTPSGYALAPYVNSKQIPGVFNSGGDDLTQRQRANWVLRTSMTSSQSMHALGEYAYQVMKLKKVSAFAPDFAFGWESLGGFQRVFEENGGKVVQKIWYPMIAKDFSPYIPQISKEIDGLYGLFGGSMVVQFFKQAEDFGLKGKMAVIGTGTTTDESTLSSMGDEILGVYSALHYSAALDNPANKKYVKAFREKAKTPPGFYAEASYTGARWIVEAAKAIQGDVENASKFLDALKRIELKDTPRGPMRIDAYGNPVQNVYIRKVERVGGELQNTVIHTYSNVSQFWKYKPEEYMKQPVYGRDYSPSKP
jgi:branched-chain amino acid transport system substrate-binding protein